MARALFSQPKQAMKVRTDAQPLRPDELIRLRQILRTPVVDDYLEAAKVAAKLGLSKRTVLDLAHAGEFDGAWGTAFKPAHNRLRIPAAGVAAYIAKRPAHSGAAPFFSVPVSALSQEER